MQREIEISKKRCLELEKETEKINKRWLNMSLYTEFKSLSCSEIYTKYCNNGTWTDCESLDLPQVDHDKLVDSWNAIIAKICDQNSQVQSNMKIALETVFETFDLSKVKFHQDSRLQNPCVYPDFIMTSSKIAEPSWLDCLSFIECKSADVPLSEGGDEAISYLSNITVSEAFGILTDKNMTFSAQTNGRKIQFFVFKVAKPNCEHYYSSELDLFTSENVIEMPSKGFESLCRFMIFLEKLHIQDEKIVINGENCNVIKTFQNNEGILGGVVNIKGEGLCVVKTVENENLNHTIEKETLIYKALENSPVRTLKMSNHSNSSSLVFKGVAKGDLKFCCHLVLYKNRSELNEEQKFQKVLNYFIELFDQIKALHDLGYIHCDIRPANVVVLDDDLPYLIDFFTVTKHGAKKIFLQGTYLYMADGLMRTMMPYTYKRKYDIESFLYSLLDCVDKHHLNCFLRSCVDFDSDEDFSPELIADWRKKRLEELRNSKESKYFDNFKFVTLFFKLWDKLNTITDDLNERNYAELKEILESFLS